MSHRREFLKHTSAIGLGSLLPFPSANCIRHATAAEAINLACIGVGGKGASDLVETSVSNNIVAICDVDESRLAEASKRFPKAKTYTDWRKLLEQTDIDAVTVSTPDHMHAAISRAAMELKKHVYTQKPLTNTVAESRQLRELAIRQGVVTQMGTQHHAASRIKNAIELVQSGIVGKISQVHAWTDRPGNYWKQGLTLPNRQDPVPDSLHWDLWLGVAKPRPFVTGLYHPFHWRGWWDFGTGALGDMGCHLLDPVFTALNLGPPISVTAEGPEPDLESGPLWCEVRYQFPGTEQTTETCDVIWYEAGRQPPRELIKAPDDWPGSLNGVLFVGSKGNVFVGFPEEAALFPVADFEAHRMPNHEDHNHYQQWTNAIKGDGATSCPFSFSGPLTEAVLLGNVAYRSQVKLNWNSQEMTTGDARADALLSRVDRVGW